MIKAALADKDGFSTIETLIAFVILSLGLGLAVQSVSQASLAVRRGIQNMSELQLATLVTKEEVPRLLSRYSVTCH